MNRSDAEACWLRSGFLPGFSDFTAIHTTMQAARAAAAAAAGGAAKRRQWFTWRRTGLAAALGAGLWAADHYLYDSSIERSVRTLATGVLIAADFRLNFSRDKADQINDLHSRVAARILSLCKHNGGLYIKFGQQVASVPVLPPQYHSQFKELFDSAPAVSPETVRAIVAAEFGRPPDEVFATFSEYPVASASIAQVHKATLADGTTVAVKIQKPQIAQQMGWDLLCHRILLLAFQVIFELPLYWTADYIESQLLLETDFVNEARNAERAARGVSESPDLASRVYVPKVYWDLTTKRVMTCEWIDGVRLTDLDALRKENMSAEAAMSAVVDVFSDQIFRKGFVHCDPHPGNILVRWTTPDGGPAPPSAVAKPAASEPGSTASTPLRVGLPLRLWPLRSSPRRQQQVVLLDHGLYVECTEQFKHDYALFWTSLFALNMPMMERIAEGWGIRNVQMFASATLQRPWKPGQSAHIASQMPVSATDVFETQRAAKEQLKHFLHDTELLPKELIFIGRNLNCVRANNRTLGSPVNRVNRMAQWAARSLGDDWRLWQDIHGIPAASSPAASSQTSSSPSLASHQSPVAHSLSHTPSPVEPAALGVVASAHSALQGIVSRVSSWITHRLHVQYWMFQTTLVLASVGFWVTNTVQDVRALLLHGRLGGHGGFEAAMDEVMRQQMREQMPGLVFDDSVFEG
ncbi:ABC1 family-domain-containing protein [Entophlyctis helioformis]|nr:ABC1 family-domain-containing protein [Entophlyctis helioformis]